MTKLSTVLIIHEDPIIRNQIGRSLTGNSHIVLDCATGVEAIALAKSYPKKIDLAVLEEPAHNRQSADIVAELPQVQFTIRFLFMPAQPQQREAIRLEFTESGRERFHNCAQTGLLLDRVRQTIVRI